MTLPSLCLVCHLLSVLCLQSLRHWPFCSTFFSWLTPLIFEKQTVIYFLLPPFFSSPLGAFSKLNLHFTASNTLSPNFLLTIGPVCNLIIPITTSWNICSCKSHQRPLDCQSQGPLIPLELFAWLNIINQYLLEVLGFFLILYFTLISGTRHGFAPLLLFQVYSVLC